MARHRQGTGKNSLHVELLHALREGGCPVCRMAASAVDRYLDDLIYEHVNDIELRETLRLAGGFCNEHSWQLEHMRAALGTAIMYRDVLNALGQRLRARQPGARLALYNARGGDRGLRDRLAALTAGAGEAYADPHIACPACRVRRDREDLLLRTLLASSVDDEFAGAYNAAMGLCLVHLEQASALTAGNGTLEAGLAVLIDHALLWIEATLGQLDEFARKHDYRFRHEVIGEEGAAWVRAIEMVAGKEGTR